MANLPSIRRILTESFPGVSWISTLLSPINAFFEGVYTALNNELTIGQNMNGVVKSITLDGTFPVKFMWTRSAAPTIAWLGYCRQVAGTTYSYTDAVSPIWEYDGEGNFVLNGVPGLDFTLGRKFLIRIIAITG